MKQKDRKSVLPKEQGQPDIFAGGYDERLEATRSLLHMDKNFDILYRELSVGGRRVSLFSIDGFLTGTVSEKVLEFFYSIEEKDMPQEFEGFMARFAPYGDITAIDTQEDFVQLLLAGLTCFLIEGYH